MKIRRVVINATVLVVFWHSSAHAQNKCEELMSCSISISMAYDLADTLRNVGYSVSWDTVKKLKSLDEKFQEKAKRSCGYLNYYELIEDEHQYATDRLVRDLKKLGENRVLVNLAKVAGSCNENY